MAKHKKTRREKKVADKRHTLYHLETETVQEKIKVSKKVSEKDISPTYIDQNTKTVKTISYDYLNSDIKKIVIVSSAVFATQIVLFFILN